MNLSRRGTVRMRCARPIGACLALAIMTGCQKPNAASSRAGLSAVVENQSPPLTPAKRRFSYYELHRKGTMHCERGEFAPAMAAFQAALDLEPNSTEALLGIGACYESLGDPGHAVICYRRILETHPHDTDALTNLGTAYIKLYRKERNTAWRSMAIGAWRQAIALNPDLADVKRYLAMQDETPGA